MSRFFFWGGLLLIENKYDIIIDSNKSKYTNKCGNRRISRINVFEMSRRRGITDLVAANAIRPDGFVAEFLPFPSMQTAGQPFPSLIKRASLHSVS